MTVTIYVSRPENDDLEVTVEFDGREIVDATADGLSIQLTPSEEDRAFCAMCDAVDDERAEAAERAAECARDDARDDRMRAGRS